MAGLTSAEIAEQKRAVVEELRLIARREEALREHAQSLLGICSLTPDFPTMNGDDVRAMFAGLDAVRDAINQFSSELQPPPVKNRAAVVS